MRAPPPLQVTLRRRGAWRAALVGLTAAGSGAFIAWMAAREAPAGAALWSAAGLGAMLLWGSTVSLLRSPASVLGFDGVDWHWRPTDVATDRACRGTLAVSLDLGGWMLLRFVPAASGAEVRALTGAGRRGVWLPVQRRGLEAQWHALRCAVHAPAVAAASVAAIEPDGI